MATAVDELGASLLRAIHELEASNPKIRRLNAVQSMRGLLGSVVPRKPAAHTLPRRRSLPMDLAAAAGPVDAETVRAWMAEAFGDVDGEIDDGAPADDADADDADASPAPFRLRRSRSVLYSSSERETRLLRAETAPKAEQERIDEAEVPKKLAYWNAGHELGELNLSQKSLQSDDFYVLCFAFRFNYPIRKLSLQACFVRDEDVRALAKSLETNCVLFSLDLSRTKVTDRGVDALIGVLASENSTLTELDLRLNTISESAAFKLSNLFHHESKTLKLLNGLDLRDFDFAPPNRVALRGMHLRLPEAILLGDCLALAKTSKLEFLDLSDNGLDAAAFFVFSRAIVEKHRGLKTLRLDGNSAGPRGAEALAAMLAVNTSLTTLSISANDLTQNGIDRTGVMRLRNVLKSNTTLTQIDVSGNGCTALDENELQTRVGVNRALTHTPSSFVEFLDGRFPAPIAASGDGGYKLSLQLDTSFIIREKLDRPPPKVAFDDKRGDDYV
eukprot:CAMPEP_0184202680 /NCGR_PEP_ID=MMETSP0976-20121227/8675_1 /TAXON_ID=483370 /ORGANISM="non described non described, Strain CCMP2097" /LENGTH=500 /DNA_ID=CAMNT_0026507233 /DNA_START=85 /DNA_END=1583 /DNA_ORIENTATION=+